VKNFIQIGFRMFELYCKTKGVCFCEHSVYGFLKDLMADLVFSSYWLWRYLKAADNSFIRDVVISELDFYFITITCLFVMIR